MPDPATAIVTSLMVRDDHDLPELASLLGRPAWQRRAACRRVPLSVFFAGKGGTYGMAAELCATCPVREECLDYALSDPTLDGFWAGTTAQERKRMRRVAG